MKPIAPWTWWQIAATCPAASPTRAFAIATENSSSPSRSESSKASAAADALLDSERLGDDEFSVAIAKARVGEAAGHVAAICHQVHGAMGFTQEHPLHFSTRRLWAWRDEWGAETYWQEQIGRIVCAQGGEGFWPLLADRPTPAAAS